MMEIIILLLLRRAWEVYISSLLSNSLGIEIVYDCATHTGKPPSLFLSILEIGQLSISACWKKLTLFLQVSIKAFFEILPVPETQIKKQCAIELELL